MTENIGKTITDVNEMDRSAIGMVSMIYQTWKVMMEVNIIK